MASWLPEILFEIVGQGPAPSKDYYQLLITQSQASASHGFLSLLTPSPPVRLVLPDSGRSRQTATVACRKRRVSANSERSPLVTSARRPESPFSPEGRLVPSEPSFLPSFPTMPSASLPASGLPTRCVPSARRRKTGVPACVPPHLSVGRRERKTQPSVPRRSPQGWKGTVSSRVGLNPGRLFFFPQRTSRWPLPHQNSSFSTEWLTERPSLTLLEPLLSH